MAKVGRRFGKRVRATGLGLETCAALRQIRAQFQKVGLRLTPRRWRVIARALLTLVRHARALIALEASAPSETAVAARVAMIGDTTAKLLKLLDTAPRDEHDEAIADAAWSTLAKNGLVLPTLAKDGWVSPDRNAFSFTLHQIYAAAKRGLKPARGRSTIEDGFHAFVSELARRYGRLRPVTAGGKKGTSERSGAFLGMARTLWALVDRRTARTTFDERVARVLYCSGVSKRAKKRSR